MSGEKHEVEVESKRGHLSCQTLRVGSCQTLRVGSCQTLRVASCQTLFFEGRKFSDSNWKLSDTV